MIENTPDDAQKRHAAEEGGPIHGGQPPGSRDMFLAVVRMPPVPMCLSDPNRPDNPLVFVNRAFAAKVDVSVEFCNYRKDRSRFWNALYFSPVFSGTGGLLYFFAASST